MLSKTFGQRLKALREERGLTQRELARRVKTQVAQISRYENGMYLPTAETLVELARTLHVGLDALVLGDRTGDGSGETPPLKNLVLLERLTDIDGLPGEDQDMLVRLIDALVKSRKGERVFAVAS